MDAALGNLGGMPGDHLVGGDFLVESTKKKKDGGGAAAAANDKSPVNKPPPAIITDYELSQIVLVPTSDW